VYGKSRELAEFILQNGFISHFTQETMLSEVVRGYEQIMSAPVTSEQERKGRELLQELETSRLNRMRAALPEGSDRTEL